MKPGIIIRIFNQPSIYSVSVIKEVILTAGTTNTPKLLQLSGVGDSSDLQQLNISVVKHLPGVGRNFQDHAMVSHYVATVIMIAIVVVIYMQFAIITGSVEVTL